MKTKKLLIALLIMLMICFLGCNNVEASTGGKTAEDAINWCRSQENQWIGSGQCVAFVSAYYSYLGQQTPSYYAARELITHVNDQPAGWVVINDSNVQPQMGDILVYSGGYNNYGHVCIYEADYATWNANWGEGSGEDGTVVRWSGSYYKTLGGLNFLGVVRPDFNADKEPPKFSDGELVLSSITANSYKVRVKVTDNVGVDYVNFAFKGASDSDFGSWSKMTNSNGYYEATINTSKKDLIIVHCYAFDKAGNSAGYAFPNWAMGSTKVNLGNFTARIISKGNANLCIGITGTTNGDDLKLVTKNTNDDTQLWNFTRLSNGNYKIINATTTNQGFDVDGGVTADANSTPIQLWNHVDGATQQEFMIVSYNNGYRLIPTNTKLGMGVNVQNASYSAGSKIVEGNMSSYNNNAQTFTFEKIESSGGKNGLHKNTFGKWYYYKNGSVDRSFTGLAEYNNSWFYVEKGEINWNYTGLFYFKNTWFYIQGGIVNWTAETLVEYNNSWFKVKGGMVDWTYTGLSYYKNTWFYIQGGMINWTAETLVEYNNSWFKVKGGMVDWNYTGLFSYKGTLFYIQGGMINWNYSGQVTYNGKKYNVKGGIAS